MKMLRSLSAARVIALGASIFGLVSAGVALTLVLNCSQPRRVELGGGRLTLQDQIALKGLAFGTQAGGSDGTDLSLVPYDSITLDVREVFAPSPLFRATFYKSGQATLLRKDSGGDMHEFHGRILPFRFARLAQIAELAQVSSEQAQYGDGVHHTTSATLIVAAGNREWQVSDNGQVAPPELWALETLATKLTEELEWQRVPLNPGVRIDGVGR